MEGYFHKIWSQLFYYIGAFEINHVNIFYQYNYVVLIRKSVCVVSLFGKTYKLFCYKIKFK